MSLQGQAFNQTLLPTQDYVTLTHHLLVVSTGLQVSPISSESFDPIANKLKHSNGCMVNENGKVESSSYAVGWCKNGPKGVLDETLLSCEETLSNIKTHIESNLLTPKQQPQEPPRFIPFSKYSEVREIELRRGNREKFIKKKMSTKELLEFYGLEHIKHQHLN
jgi:hypothetical protein